MRLRNYLLLGCIPLFTACQVLSSNETEQASLMRVQGQLFTDNGQMYLQPCEQDTRIKLREGQSNLFYEVAQLGEKDSTLFVDLDGQKLAQTPDELTASHIYRLELEGKGCAGARERRLILQAQGNEPNWMIQIQPKGLVLLRMDAEPLALPYVEEQMGEDRYYFATEADHQKIELSVAPQRCIDSMSGTLFHLSAELRFNGVVHRGCASLGNARNRNN